MSHETMPHERSRERAGADAIAGTLDFSRDAAALAADVAQRSAIDVAFAFVEGFKVEIARAAAVAAAPAAPPDLARGPAPQGATGDLAREPAAEGATGELARGPAGWQVACGRGALALLEYRVLVDGQVCTDLELLVRTCALPAGSRLTRVPFADDAAVRAFERRIERWRAHTRAPEPSPQHRRDQHEALPDQNADLARFLVEAAGAGPGAEVLDLGCGSGWACRMFARLGLRATGVDVREDAVAMARRLVPEARFEVLDVYRLAERSDWVGRFDLVFCRGLGVAQRLLDWSDPEWVAVGTGLVELLKPGGLLYWTHHGCGTGRVGPDGFSHATLATLEAWFARRGVVLRAVDCVLQSLLVARSELPQERRRHVASLEHAVRRRVLALQRAAFTAGREPSPASLAALSACAWAALAPLARTGPAPVLVRGAGRLAQLCAATCEALGLPVLALVEPDRPFDVLGDHAVVDAAGARALPAATLVLPEPDAAAWWTGPRLVVFPPSDTATAVNAVPLVTGDVDLYYEQARLDRYAEVRWTRSPPPAAATTPLAPWDWTPPDGRAVHAGESPAHSAAESPAQGAAESPAHAAGETPAQGAAESPAHAAGESPAHAAGEPGADPARGAAHGHAAGTRAPGAGAVRRVASPGRLDRALGAVRHAWVRAGVWVRCDRPAAVRLVLSAGARAVASRYHAGDGGWRFLGVSAHLPGGAAEASLALLVEAGAAELGDGWLVRAGAAVAPGIPLPRRPPAPALRAADAAALAARLGLARGEPVVGIGLDAATCGALAAAGHDVRAPGDGGGRCRIAIGAVDRAANLDLDDDADVLAVLTDEPEVVAAGGPGDGWTIAAVDVAPPRGLVLCRDGAAAPSRGAVAEHERAGARGAAARGAAERGAAEQGAAARAGGRLVGDGELRGVAAGAGGGWSASAGAVVQGRNWVAPDLPAVRLRCTGATAYLVQRLDVSPPYDLVVSCWARTSVPEAARIQLSDGADRASAAHPGDGCWHRLTLAHAGTAESVDLYLQVVLPGDAEFADVRVSEGERA